MPAGIVIYNDFDTILIDENYTNMTMLSSGIVTCGLLEDELGEEPVYGDTLGFTPAFGEKIALHSSGCFSTLVGNVVYSDVNGGVVYWYRFGPPPPPAPNGAGFQVFNAAGQCTFDSNLKAARVLGSMVGTAPSALPSQSFPAGRGYAVIHSKRGVRTYGRRFNIGQPDSYRIRIMESSAAKQVGDSVQFAMVRTNINTPSGRLDFTSGQVNAQILDITGYLGN